MPDLIVNLEEGAFKKFINKNIIHLTNTIEVAPLAGGMKSGKASVAFGFEIDSETVVIAETSLELFIAAANILEGWNGKEVRE